MGVGFALSRMFLREWQLPWFVAARRESSWAAETLGTLPLTHSTSYLQAHLSRFL